MHHFLAVSFNGNEFRLNDYDLKQIKTVLKLQTNEQIICIFNSQHFLCKIELIGVSKEPLIKLIEALPINNELPIKIKLIVGLIREQKWDWVLQKATELGVSEIVPVQFNRSVVQINSERVANKVQRWARICKEAAEQSRRNIIPVVYPVVSKLSQLAIHKSELNLIAYEKENANFLSKYLQSQLKSISIVVGPEGGITESELNVLINLGFVSVSLGRAILRAETASVYALSAVKFICEIS